MNQDNHHPRPRLMPLATTPGFMKVVGLGSGLLRHTPLYLRSGDSFRLIERNDQALEPAQEGHSLDHLYIMSDDKERAIAEIQQNMVRGQLKALLRGGELAQAKLALTCLLGEAFSDPRLKMLDGMRQVVETLVEEMAQDRALVQAFLMVGGESYGLAEHGVNVMALLVGLAQRVHRAKDGLGEMALAAMLHDLGKTQMHEDLHVPARPLSDQEYALIRRHPEIGVALLRERGFSRTVMEGIAQHHERLDGSGYPLGVRELSLAGQLVGMANSYEALTNPIPPRPRRLSALETLALLKREVDQGKFDPGLFETFAYSLTR